MNAPRKILKTVARAGADSIAVLSALVLALPFALLITIPVVGTF